MCVYVYIYIYTYMYMYMHSPPQVVDSSAIDLNYIFSYVLRPTFLKVNRPRNHVPRAIYLFKQVCSKSVHYVPLAIVCDHLSRNPTCISSQKPQNRKHGPDDKLDPLPPRSCAAHRVDIIYFYASCHIPCYLFQM